MFQDTPRIFLDFAPVFARLVIWNRRFGPAQVRLRGCQLQKVSASDEGFLTLNVFKPADDRTAVVLSIRKGESGISVTTSKPHGQPKPNAIVSVMRKYLVGRRIRYAFAGLQPVAFFIQFEPSTDPDPEIRAGPDTLILDLDAKPPRVVVAKRYSGVHPRYENVVTVPFSPLDDFYESYCEWSLDATKTKRRATFTEPVLTFSVMPAVAAEAHDLPAPEKTNSVPLAEPVAHSLESVMSVERAMTLLPVHVRRPAKTRAAVS